MIHWIRGARRERAAIDLDAMSYEAIAAVMNALNPSPHDFACDGDRQAFAAASLAVAERWSQRNATSSHGLS